MTLNWAMQVSRRPEIPRRLGRALRGDPRPDRRRGCFSVALVAREDREVVRRFVKPAEHDAEAHTLGGVGYRDGLSGAPIPELAVAYLDCGLRHSLDLGSHSMFVGEVLDAGFADGGETVRFFAPRTPG